MMHWLVSRMFGAAMRSYGMTLPISWRFTIPPQDMPELNKVAALARHRKADSLEAAEAARLTSVMAEDCGPCTQLIADIRASKA